MKLKLNEIIDYPGSSIPFDYEADFRDLEINYSKPFVNPAHIYGKAANNAGILLLKAQCDTVIRYSCDRCAEETDKNYSIAVEAVLAESLESPDDIDNSDIVLIENAEVDVDEVVRSAIILESDMQLLCSEECKGLCPRCGRNLNEGPCDCPPEIDPRLEKLSQYFAGE
jgi:uncharacterized protein